VLLGGRTARFPYVLAIPQWLSIIQLTINPFIVVGFKVIILLTLSGSVKKFADTFSRNF
jgi:hypothetical protein